MKFMYLLLLHDKHIDQESILFVGKPDLVGLALWLIYERWLGEKSLWYTYLKTFPAATLSPILWSKTEQEALLKGTSIAGFISLLVCFCTVKESPFAEYKCLFGYP